MKNKTMRKAMITSIIALVVCFAMLVGTTYAWFTDQAAAANNIIKSGKLDMVLEYTTDFQTWTEVTAQTKLFDDNALFEPGYVEVAYVRVRNAGTLAFKYKLAANIVDETAGKNQAGEDFMLSDSLKFGSAAVTAAYADRAAAAAVATTTLSDAAAGAVANDAVLEAGQASAITALVIAMPTTVGNEANYGTTQPKITLGLTALATQATVEADSFDNQYDANAQYPVASLDGAKAALASGKDVVLAGNVSTTLTSAADAIVVDGQTFDGNGKTLTLDSSNDVNNFVIQAKSGTVENVTIDGAWRGRGIGGNAAMTGDLEINNVKIDGPLYAINVGNGNGKNITVKDSEINGWSSIAGANTTFEDCKFGEANGYATFAVHSTTTFINCEFCDGFSMFGRRPESPDGTTVGTLTLTNCKYNGTLVTAENFQSLFDQDHDIDFNAFKTNENVSVIINGVDAQQYITVNP